MKVYPNTKEAYELLEPIGKGATATVYRAKCIPHNEVVAVKVINLEQYGANIDEIRTEISVMSQCSHANVVTYYTSFVVGEELWLVMRLLSGGSALDIMRSISPKGLDETVIATILRETLKALAYFHKNNQIHRDVKAGNILIDADGTVQLADFGVSSWLVEGGERKRQRQTFVGTPCWMAPEVMEQVHGYNTKADIWSFGITAIELATGHAPYAQYPPMKVLVMTLNNDPPTLDLNEHPRYSKYLKKMIDSCLQKDPAKRPTADELLKHPLFQKAKGKEFLAAQLLAHLPPLTQRYQTKAQKPQVRKPGQSGKLVKDDKGEWQWEWDEGEGDDEAPQDNVPPPAGPSQAAGPSGGGQVEGVAAGVAGLGLQDEQVNFKLRLRDSSNQLKDIEFAFRPAEDTPELIAGELVEAGFVGQADCQLVAESMRRLLANPVMGSSVRFPVGAPQGEPDPETLVGYAMMCVV